MRKYIPQIGTIRVVGSANSYVHNQDNIISIIKSADPSDTIKTLQPCPLPYKSIGSIKKGAVSSEVNLCVNPKTGYLCSVGRNTNYDIQSTNIENRWRHAAIRQPFGYYDNKSLHTAGSYSTQARDWADTSSQVAWGTEGSDDRAQMLIPTCNVEAIMLENMHGSLNDLPNKIAEAMKSATKANDSSAPVRYDDNYDPNHSNDNYQRGEEYYGQGEEEEEYPENYGGGNRR